MNAPPDNILADPNALFAYLLLLDNSGDNWDITDKLLADEVNYITQDRDGMWYGYKNFPTEPNPSGVWAADTLRGEAVPLAKTTTLKDWRTHIYEVTRS